MAQFALTTAVNVARAYLIGSARRAIAGLFAERGEAGRIEDFAIQTSSEGAPVSIVHGRMRVAGEVIWAARPVERVQTRSASGGKGGPKVDEYSYTISFAVAIAEGPVSGIGAVWADSTLLDRSRTVMRVHLGGEDQLPDPLIEAIEGPGKAPAYRGLAYVVFEDLPLGDFGGRIPNLAFEVFGARLDEDAAALEARVQGVCLIPASGEFAYADRAVMREIAEGHERPENHHTTRASCDLEAALDDLEAQLPQCRSVALVTAWFGDDLRAGVCTLKPGVETRDKVTRPLVWQAAGLTRAAARLITQTQAGPVYGGTPSDETVIAAIQALKARGYAVTLYPFILMDVAEGNALPDPYGGAEQAAFPWRGRITCHPAPGQAGTVDKTAAAGDQVEAFFGAASASDFQVAAGSVSYSGGEDWGFRRFILHHAALAAAAGGVESFIIGSEMRGLTQVRSGASAYPAVARLQDLAGEARAILGPQVNISYAADWSEYFGHQPADGSGDRLFHLDPLWADAEIDFVGIDWYAPLSDWREGQAHLDALAGARAIHDREYLAAQVEGGEGYDWYYASSADRNAQVRTPISDGGHGEPFVFRYKDVRNWWAQAHHDRIAGVRQSTPTAWVPESKPIRLVELGCPAVDKGANQPNVFIDPKSSESFAPYHSSGARDDLIQRRYIETLLDYWSPAAGRNPISSLDGRAMLDLAHSHVWTWDARPFPEFPARTDVWTDGPNWRRGHWLNGRAGQSSVARIAKDIARRAGLEELDASALSGVLAGYIIEGPVSARALLERLGAVFGFTLADRAGGPALLPIRNGDAPNLINGDWVADLGPSHDRLAFTRTSQDALPSEARLLFRADTGDYRTGVVSARGLDHVTEGAIEISLPALADRTLAADWARGVLRRARAEAETARLALPPSLARLEAGDPVILDAGPAGRTWRIAVLDGLSVREAELTGAPAGPALISGPDPEASPARPPTSRPVLHLLDLPLGPGEGAARDGFWAAAFADPWPGELVVYAGADLETATERARITAPAFCGKLTAVLGPGAEGRWDFANALEIQLSAGALSSATPVQVLGGANRIAVETSLGWEVVSFTQAALCAPDHRRLTALLRGLGASPLIGAQVGARIVVLDLAGVVMPVGADERGAALSVAAVAPGLALSEPAARILEAVYDGADRRPLAPVHLSARWSGQDIGLTWIRRGRVEANAWGAGDIVLGEDAEIYRLRLLDATATPVREMELSARAYTLTQQDRAVWFPDGIAEARFEVSQVAAGVGAGAPRDAPLDPARYG